jgi:hypothetical protein
VHFGFSFEEVKAMDLNEAAYWVEVVESGEGEAE